MFVYFNINVASRATNSSGLTLARNLVTSNDPDDPRNLYHADDPLQPGDGSQTRRGAVPNLPRYLVQGETS